MQIGSESLSGLTVVHGRGYWPSVFMEGDLPVKSDEWSAHSSSNAPSPKARAVLPPIGIRGDAQMYVVMSGLGAARLRDRVKPAP